MLATIPKFMNININMRQRSGELHIYTNSGSGKLHKNRQNSKYSISTTTKRNYYYKTEIFTRFAKYQSLMCSVIANMTDDELTLLLLLSTHVLPLPSRGLAMNVNYSS